MKVILTTNSLCEFFGVPSLQTPQGKENIPFKGIYFSLPTGHGPIVAVMRDSSFPSGLPASWIKNNPSLTGATIGREATGPLAGIPHFQVNDVRKSLYAMAIYARKQVNPYSLFFSVVGSAGKTSTTSMLAHVLRASSAARKTVVFGRGNTPLYIASELISTPSDADYYVLEIAGAAEDGERPLAEASAELVRPDIAIFTSLSYAHMDKMGTLENAAFKKASVFSYLNDNGTAIINRDIPYFDIIRNRVPGNSRILTYGSDISSDIRLLNYDFTSRIVTVSVSGENCTFTCGASGIHNAMNSLAVISALVAAGLDWKSSLKHFATWKPLRGRGRTFNVHLHQGETLTIIDEAYNANPVSMSSALKNLNEYVTSGRRIAVIGEMLELGDHTDTLHDQLITEIISGKLDRLYLCGEAFRQCHHRLPSSLLAGIYSSPDEVWDALKNDVRDQDIIMFKGSNSTRLHEIVKRLENTVQPDGKDP